jgi:hypothetical protein
VESDHDADVGNRAIGIAEQGGRALQPTREEVVVRALTERPAELAAEMSR